ncbi:MAG: cell division protein FtsZ [Betaproteobacteria bacterium]|jgi:cell division protein FtsZ|nr:cell division protein FtsZ [Betaproteobacteria bacterium]
MKFEVMEAPKHGAVIKVIGVGGCGGNAVDHMINRGVQGVEFICANTDQKALVRTQAATQIAIGQQLTKGLGAGARPEIGRNAALEDRERLVDAVAGADMLFITAGMGGGTGTGAAPIVAQVARELGILTVAVVTKPFGFEGKRMEAAVGGIAELAQHVDSVIVIPNEKLMLELGGDVSLVEAFAAANDVLHGAVAGIAEVINSPGMIGVDFADVKTVMGEMGMAMMGSASASGVDRARIAAESAVASPLLEDVELRGARGVLVNITADHSLKLSEINQIMETIRAYTAEDATVIFGTAINAEMGDALRVTVVATGLGKPHAGRPAKPVLEVIDTGFMNTRTGTDDATGFMPPMDSGEIPAVFGSGRTGRGAPRPALTEQNLEQYDIPAFLRRQAD